MLSVGLVINCQLVAGAAPGEPTKFGILLRIDLPLQHLVQEFVGVLSHGMLLFLKQKSRHQFLLPEQHLGLHRYRTVPS